MNGTRDIFSRGGAVIVKVEDICKEQNKPVRTGKESETKKSFIVSFALFSYL